MSDNPLEAPFAELERNFDIIARRFGMATSEHPKPYLHLVTSADKGKTEAPALPSRVIDLPCVVLKDD